MSGEVARERLGEPDEPVAVVRPKVVVTQHRHVRES